MKLLICLVLLAACTEALPRRKDVRKDEYSQLGDLIDELLELEMKKKETVPQPVSKRQSCDVEEVEMSPGQVLEGALVSHTGSDDLYPNNACQTWVINSEKGQCIAIVVGDGGFDTESNYDEVVIQDYTQRFVHHVTSISSHHSEGDVLFDSKTHGVKVTFTSDGSVRRSGFTLDVRSAPCHTKAKPPKRHCIPQELDVSPGDVIESALVSHTESDDLYPNNACQSWIISAKKGQCIGITVGDGGFDTEPNDDYVTIEDIGSRGEVDCENNVVPALGGSPRGTRRQKSAKKRQYVVPDVCVLGDIMYRVGDTQGVPCDFCRCMPNLEWQCEINGRRSADISSQHPERTVLFDSLTNRVNVTFTSDGSINRSGFKLDVSSTSCHSTPKRLI